MRSGCGERHVPAGLCHHAPSALGLWRESCLFGAKPFRFSQTECPSAEQGAMPLSRTYFGCSVLRCWALKTDTGLMHLG